MNRRRFMAVCAAFAAAPASAETHRWQAPALGGVVSVDLRGPRALAAETARAIAAAIAEVEAAASLFRPDSALSRLNRTGRLDDPPKALRDLLALAGQLHVATDGAFDATVQPLWRALAEGADPAAARARVGWSHVHAGAAAVLGPGQALTLNGIAQGYAADRVRAILRLAGYERVLVDMGEYAALSGPFRIGVEDPELGRIAIRDLLGDAIATSSPGAMRIGADFHILGPHGQQPVWSTVSVQAASAAMADGLSTAFCLMEMPAIRAATARLTEVSAVTLAGFSGDVTTLQIASAFQ